MNNHKEFLPLAIFGLLCLCLLLSVHSRNGCTKSPILFNFGDSNSDTGGYSAGHGSVFGRPEGRTFFRQPAGRLCDGRLIIDFLCESLNASYLTPYLESLGPNFTNGANFAVDGSSILPKNAQFNLDIQLAQFFRFRARSPALVLKGVGDLVGEEGFQDALYIIDIGQNDLAAAFTYLPYDQIIEKIPLFITEIKNAISGIYQHGGKNFWVHNTGPLGCLPQKLATQNHMVSDLDEIGCLKPLNEAAKVFNDQLRSSCEELRSQMKDATIVYVDVYTIKYGLIAHASESGFEDPLMACCGHGGAPYNYNASVLCGQSGYSVCEEGTNYVSWDGVHYTEAANAIFASKILSANYSTPPLTLDFFFNN